MAGKLDGQVAIVTGGGRGIGRTIAGGLAAEGAAVTVTARSVDQLAEAAAAIQAAGGRALALHADVTDLAAVERVVEETEQKLGPVDLLVNNAGVLGPLGPLWEVNLAEWRRCIEVHFTGAATTAHVVLPGMVRRGRGRIINVGSIVALRPTPYVSAYGIAKTALLRLTEALAAETREHSVHVFAIEPGAVHTAMIDELVTSPWLQKALPTVPREDPVRAWSMAGEGAAQLCIRLAAGEADVLSGRFINVRDDLAELVRRAPEIEQGDLYTLRLRR